MDIIQNFDNSVILFMDSFVSHEILDWLMRLISFLGNSGFIWILIALTLIIKGKNTRKSGVLMLLCIGACAVVTNLIIKPSFARIRPYDALGLDIIIPPQHDYSFPSGHTTAAVSGAVALHKYYKKQGGFMYVFAVFMGLSRIYLLVHYPSDVIVGALIGYFVSKIVIYFWDKYSHKLSI